MKKTCEDCEGTGLTFPIFDSDCVKCGGTGLVMVEPAAVKSPFTMAADGKLATALCDLEDCSDWEASFADSIYKQVEDGRILTEKQIGKCREILERRLTDEY